MGIVEGLSSSYFFSKKTMETNKNKLVQYATIASWAAGTTLLIVVGVSLLPKFSDGNTNANSVYIMRDQQAELDKQILDLKPEYAQYQQKFNEAQKKMSEIESQGKSLRAEREQLESSIREITDSKKD